MPATKAAPVPVSTAYRFEGIRAGVSGGPDGAAEGRTLVDDLVARESAAHTEIESVAMDASGDG